MIYIGFPFSTKDRIFAILYCRNSLENEYKALGLVIEGLPRARSARGTEPHTHRLWSTSFPLVVT